MAKMTVRRERGYFMVDYYEDQKRRRKYFKTEVEAQDYADRLRYKANLAQMGITYEEKKTHRIYDAIHQFMNGRDDKPSFRAEQTWFERLWEFFKSKQIEFLDEVKLEHLEELRKERASKVKAATANREFVSYKAFFEKCVNWEKMDRNPLRGLKPLRETTVKRVIWTDEQISEVAMCAPKWFSSVFKFLAMTGVRPVEAVKAKWSDVSFADGVISVHSWKNAHGGRRSIALSDSALEHLKSLPRRTGYIFLNADGDPVTVDHLGKTFADLREEIGLPSDLQLYGLRHSFATNLVRMNVNLKVVKDLLGHSQFRTTERYIQVGIDQQKEAANLLKRSFIKG